MAVAEPPVQQLPPDTVLDSGAPVAALTLEPRQLDERVPLEWHTGEDDLGAYDAVVITDGTSRWALVAYRDSPERSLIVVGERDWSPDALKSVLSALKVSPSEIADLATPADGLDAEGSSQRANTSTAGAPSRTQKAGAGSSEFVEQVASKSGLSKRQAGTVVNAVLEAIEETLKGGGEVTFTGFGKFHVAQRAGREGRNPRTGETMTIAASRVPRFTAGSGLKRAVES